MKATPAKCQAALAATERDLIGQAVRKLNWANATLKRERDSVASVIGAVRNRRKQWKLLVSIAGLDPNGNRLTQTGSTPQNNVIGPGNNELAPGTISYDAKGDITGIATSTGTYNDRGRLVVFGSTAGTTNYTYNALGQFVAKTGYDGPVVLMYDEAGHIIGEYNGTGQLIEETIWMGDIPVATIVPSGTTITGYYIHTDHLGTPRKLTRPSDNALMWRWDPGSFGSTAANTNPSGQGTVNYNLRFPGMYYQAESGLMQNGFRDFWIVPHGVVYESRILARSTRDQLTTADNRTG